MKGDSPKSGARGLACRGRSGKRGQTFTPAAHTLGWSPGLGWAGRKSRLGPGRHSPGVAHHLMRVRPQGSRLSCEQTHLGEQRLCNKSQVPRRPGGQLSARAGLAETRAAARNQVCPSPPFPKTPLKGRQPECILPCEKPG